MMRIKDGRRGKKLFLLVLTAISSILFEGCKKSVPFNNKLFNLMPSEHTGIDFANDLSYTETFNPFTYNNFYNGGGVAAGDINNDGLIDLFFCGNLTPNKLYINKGNFEFVDISHRTSISAEGMWYSGVTMVDVNGDGWLDIFLTRAADLLVGWRGNELYINNKDYTFTESAEEYGLSKAGFSTHAVFFDMDNDNDLDCYLLSNSKKNAGERNNNIHQREIIDKKGGNKLFRNDNNKFVDVTEESGIYGSVIGFGLGAAIADINKDGWQDIYVSNDFFEKDYLYLNKGDGTFKESLEEFIRETSMFSMGADIADINNDGYPDIYVTDMLPEKEHRIKSKTNFDDWTKYQQAIEKGYYKQFIRNVLQLNTGPVYVSDSIKPEYHFTEISRLSGVHATDWSWGALITDLNNDGWKDIFVANGMAKDVTDMDAIEHGVFNRTSGMKISLKEFVDMLPSEPLANYVFSNNGDLTFTDMSEEWGLDEKVFANGSVYADLDNDGDLDLITNNINSKASVYRNNSETLFPDHNYLKVILKGEGKNTRGIGAKVTVYYDQTLAFQEVVPTRGFQSTVDARLNFGLGKAEKIDSMVVEWPGGMIQVLKDLKTNRSVECVSGEATIEESESPVAPEKIFRKVKDGYGINFIHQEDAFNDFEKNNMMFFMQSTKGPGVAVGDVNGDELEDVYMGGAAGHEASLFIQDQSGGFERRESNTFRQDMDYEDTDAQFSDLDDDGDLDLIVCSGGNRYAEGSEKLSNRIYINDGKGNFKKSNDALPSNLTIYNTSSIATSDFDSDGDIDIFLGTGSRTDFYGTPGTGYLLENDGNGKFSDVTAERAGGLINIGMVNHGAWVDYNLDEKPDLVIAGDFMPVTVFENTGEKLVEVTEKLGLLQSNGWWNTIAQIDANKDGYPDLIVGNHGLNSRFKTDISKPVSMYVKDFDLNGKTEQILCMYNGEKQFPVALRYDLLKSMPGMELKYPKYADYMEVTIKEMFPPGDLDDALALNAWQFQTCLFVNEKGKGFNRVPLPVEAQFSPVYAISIDDFNKDGLEDIVLGGNFYEAKPELGIYDASYGQLFSGDGKGNFKFIPPVASNMLLKGAIREIRTINTGSGKALLIGKNNGPVEILKYR